jgi:membrane protein implicated in regulation of membrane protease activity
MSAFLIIINPLVAVSFLTVFGGLGLLGTHLGWNGLLIFLGSIMLAIAIAVVLYRYVALPLYRSENSSHTCRADLIGKTAVVISPVLKNGFGEIRYTINDTRYNAPAREIDGHAVEQGTAVVICRIEENTFFISRIERI